MQFTNLEQIDSLEQTNWVVCPALQATHIYDREADTIRQLPLNQDTRFDSDVSFDRVVPIQNGYSL